MIRGLHVKRIVAQQRIVVLGKVLLLLEADCVSQKDPTDDNAKIYLKSPYVGCGINNRTSLIIGRPISTVTYPDHRPLIGQRYLRGCRALEADRPFLSQVIATKTNSPK